MAMRLVPFLATIACLALSLAQPLGLAASDAAAEFAKAMGGDDRDAKRAVIAKYAGKDAGKDDEVLPLLAQAVADRQAAEFAIAALRARTGLAPSGKKGAGGYPDYPAADTASDWASWIAARTKAEAEKKQLAETKKLAEQASKKADENAKKLDPASATGAAPAGDATAAAAVSATAAAPAAKGPSPDLGKLDRILLRGGGSLLCFIVSKRLDADGNLLSVRIVHQDGDGEETLAAGLISRIEEDVR